ncbi:lipopolysaccharide export system protein LptA [bacterium MnTg03]|nr:lipopolysaccharide export system protein LptA [bacterium MnTg03]
MQTFKKGTPIKCYFSRLRRRHRFLLLQNRHTVRPVHKHRLKQFALIAMDGMYASFAGAKACHKIIRINRATFVSTLILLLPLQLFALSSDQQQPIQVEADSLEIRDQENISIYTGNVLMNQGSLEISCEQLTLHFDDQKEIILMEMTGAPATYRQLDDDKQELNGQADQMQYRQSESILVMTGNARFIYKGNKIESNIIRISTDNQGIQAGSSETDDRVKMLIQPGQK